MYLFFRILVFLISCERDMFMSLVIKRGLFEWKLVIVKNCKIYGCLSSVVNLILWLNRSLLCVDWRILWIFLIVILMFWKFFFIILFYVFVLRILLEILILFFEIIYGLLLWSVLELFFVLLSFCFKIWMCFWWVFIVVLVCCKCFL